MKRLTFFVSVIGILVLVAPLHIVGLGASFADDPEVASAGQVNSPAGTGNPADVIVHGVYLRPINNYGTEVLAFDDLVGKDIGILHYFVGWQPCSWTWLPSQVRDQVPPERRPQIMLSWVPKGRNCRTMPPDQPGNWAVNPSLYDIADGHCDDYISHMARQLKDLPFTFLIRFAQEMNIQSAVWWVGYYNKDPQLYIDAYRRVHDVFAAEGVTNVQWVWSPEYASNPPDAWNSLFNYYPGDEYVDWVGLVVFNWGAWLNVPWWSLTDLLDSDTWDHVLPEVMCRYAKPIILDLGSVDGTRPGDGTKEDWVQDAYQAIDRFGFIKAVVWFNDWDDSNQSKADFRVTGGSSYDSDPWHTGYAYPLPEGDGRWTQGYSAAIARDEFISYLPPLEDITPPSTWCGGEPVFDVPPFVYAEPGDTKPFVISGAGLTEDVHVSLSGLPPQVTAQLSQQYLQKPWDWVQVQLKVAPNTPLGPIHVTVSFTSSTYAVEQQESLTLIITDKLYRAYMPFVSK